MKSLRWILPAIALAALPVEWAVAQQSPPPPYASIAREGYRLTKAQVEALEAALTGNPDDLATRTKLLGFYFRGAINVYGREATIAARRRHILWLIEHHPGSEVVGLSEATIDPAGHSLADNEGYEQAAKLWMLKAQLAGNRTAELGNAARFFRLADKERSAALLKRAQQAAPNDAEWSNHLGYLYALAILGVDGMNQNGLPTRHNPTEAKGRFAKQALEELENSTNSTMVGVAGRILGLYGLMMGATSRGDFAVDYVPLADAFLTKAQALEPANPFWSRSLEEFHKLRSQAQPGNAK